MVATFASNRPEHTRLGVFILCCVVLLGVYWDSFASMVRIWMESDTFAHGFLIAPIVLYLIHEQRQVLARCVQNVDWLGVAGVFAAGVMWFVAAVADVRVGEQLAIVAMIPALVVAVFGRTFALTIAFPLAFLFLMVPIGEEFTPFLIDRTADFVVAALRASGIPVFREGTQFVIPSSRWSVVSGCSGMRYLMATITVAALYAYLNYVSYWRRAIFIAVAIATAIFANWLRAYGIVMIAHFSDMKLALGIDHYIYGWVFFGIIIFTLMAVGRYWQQEFESPELAGDASAVADPSERKGVTAVAVTLLAIMVAWPILVAQLAGVRASAMPDPVFNAESSPAGWVIDGDALSHWTPLFHGQSSLSTFTAKQAGVSIGSFIAWYRQQTDDAEVVNARNKLVYEKDGLWSEQRLGRNVPIESPLVSTVNESVMKSVNERFLVWQWYWIGGKASTRPAQAKIDQLKALVGGRGSAGASIIIYTPTSTDDYEPARARLAAYIESIYPLVAREFERAVNDK